MNDILFKIRIATSALEELAKAPGGTARIEALSRQYVSMNREQLIYKGIERGTDGLLAWMKDNGVGHE